MFSSALTSYLHVICILGMYVPLCFEAFLLKPKLSKGEVQTLFRADAIYGVSAIGMVATGLLRMYYFGKGVEYYGANYLFILKFSLFIVVGLLSIYPTIQFFKLRKKVKQEAPLEIEVSVYKRVRTMIYIEIALLSIIPLLASMMARFMGYMG